MCSLDTPAPASLGVALRHLRGPRKSTGRGVAKPSRPSIHEIAKIRAGCHTGEIELAGTAIRGIAVHIGARVASLAGSAEVWTSSTVKDLVAGSGLVFEGAGEHELKGVPDRWHLYRVTSPRADSGTN